MAVSKPTKSFFEQENTRKPRPGQWHQRPQKRAPLAEANPNAPPKPPIPATSQAKSKLKAFQFSGERQDESSGEAISRNVNGAEIANETSSSAPAAAEKPVFGDAAEDSSKPTPQLQHAQTFPSTPGAKLQLEDLIGNFEEGAKKSEPAEISPEEHIGWIPNSSSTLLTPNRKRKRARSSSPSCPNTSSQRQEPSVFFAGTAAQGDLVIPEADPAADLWQRYAAAKQIDGALNLPELGLHASPRALETPAKNGPLRRWASTGNDWPSSKNKRRRMNGKTSISVWQAEQAAKSGTKSKVAAMVDKLQESLASQKLASAAAKPAARIEGPSSSSPLPETGAAESFGTTSAESPLQAKQGPMPSKPSFIQNTEFSKTLKAPEFTNQRQNPNLPEPQHQSGDSVISAPLYLSSKAPLPAYKRPSITRTPSDKKQQLAKATVPAPAAAVFDFDEFGDDLDLTAEDLDEIMTQPPPLHQRPLHQIPPHPDPPPAQQLSMEDFEPRKDASDRAGQACQPIPIDDDDDEFGCGDLDDAALVQVEMNATQAYRTSPRRRSPRKSASPRKPISPGTAQFKLTDTPRPPRRLQRFIVTKVFESTFTNAKGGRSVEKVVVAEDEKKAIPVSINLRGSWFNTSVAAGTIVHIAYLQHRSDKTNTPGQFIISDAEDSPVLIITPDHMLSATTVADSFDCVRKAVLQDRIKATSEASKPMVYGKILHEIFQQALSANQWDDGFLAGLVEKTVHNHVEGLWELGMADTVLAIEEIRAKMAELASWARIFVVETPSEMATIEDKQSEKIWLSVSKLIAIEEHIWSPLYGLKGNIDATVQATVVDHPKEPAKKLITPFEVKTGRITQSPAHRAQTALYTLMLSDRYDVAVAAGILYYMESSTLTRIAPPINEMRQMVQQRNRLAGYIYRAKYPAGIAEADSVPAPSQAIEDSGLPTMLKNPFKCGRCYAQQACFSYHALIESGSSESAGMIDDGKKNHSQIWHEVVGHLQLTSKDKTYSETVKRWFKKWDRLLTFEESEISRFRKELWTMGSAERETTGRCFGNLIISQDLTSAAANMTSSVIDGIEGSGGKINRFPYVFSRFGSSSRASFTDVTQMAVGDPIVVSSEGGQWALANGYIIGLTKHEITVAVDRKLGAARQRQADFDAETNQSFRGIMTVGQDATTPTSASTQTQILYRVDKDEFSNGLALVRSNLVTIMSSHPIHTKLRNQIIFSANPSFSTTTKLPTVSPSQLGDMNEDQVAAVAKVLNAQDYALILGMPGTGKTTTIAHVIRALLAEDKTILLTSYTHTAVDNILLKIRDVAPPNSILRLGVPAKINPQVQEFCQLAATPRKTIDEIEACYMGCQIVATTCMGTNHALFNRRAFDVCIVDEASQITLPTSLGPLLHARKFVLVGDHYQLPPLVQNKAALEAGLDVSLFRQLSEEHPEAVATLGKQYRMCEDIMSLSNALIYSGQLRCGNDAVAKRTLQSIDMSALSTYHAGDQICTTPSRGGKCWLSDLCQPSRKVIFANTDLAGKRAAETLNAGKNITNDFEVTLTAQLVLSFLAIGVPAKEIGVITLYRSQLALLRRLFKVAGISTEVEIDSADRFQGRDKECVILSMVRSNENGIVGDLLKDWRRVNVALTRARSKLVVLGSRSTLQNNDLLAKFLGLVDEKGWAVELPKDADECHSFDFSSQVASGMASMATPDGKKTKGGSPMKKAKSESPARRTDWRSPIKTTPNISPSKATRKSQASVLKESPSAANRNLIISPAGSKGRSGLKKAGKVIDGRSSQTAKKKALEEAAFFIFEDLDADDL